MSAREFSAYFDESGKKDSTAAVVVAGFVAPANQWIAFERDWKAILSKFGVASLHMKDFAHSTGEYSSWKRDEKRRRDFLSRLIGMTRIRAQHSFAAVVFMEDYWKVNQEYKLHEVITPYTMAARTCAGKVRKWASQYGVEEERVALFFEDGDEDKGDLMRRMKRDGYRQPVFLSKGASVVFQAADMLAYEHLLANKKYLAGEITAFEDLRYPLRELDRIPNGPDSSDWCAYYSENLKQFCADLGLPSRDSDVEIEWPKECL